MVADKLLGILSLVCPLIKKSEALQGTVMEVS